MMRISRAHDEVMDKARQGESEKKLRTRIMQLELNLMIDHRLGVDFPKAKRDALWEIRQQIEAKRVRLTVRFLFDKLLFGYFLRKKFSHRLQGMAEFIAKEFSKVLDDEELVALLGEEVHWPALPIDYRQIGKD